MLDRSFPCNFYKVNVVSALPTIEITTSLPSSPQVNADIVICSSRTSLFNGETKNCEITIINTSDIPIEYLEMDLQCSLEQKLQKRIFKFDQDEIQKSLPLLVGKSLIVQVQIYAEAEFIGSIGTPVPPAMSSLTPHQQTDGPSSLSGVNSLMSGTGNSVPSRVNSPIRRNNEQTSSFRSSTASGTVNSGHSSLATLSLGTILNGGNQTRIIDAKFKFRYSGGKAQIEGYCRECAVAFCMEFNPSIQVTSWDVLPAEVPSQFYLVLDVANLTQQEVSLNYSNDKSILIEPKESCRVPIPVERCPLDRILSDYHLQQQQLALSMSTTNNVYRMRLINESFQVTVATTSDHSTFLKSICLRSCVPSILQVWSI